MATFAAAWEAEDNLEPGPDIISRVISDHFFVILSHFAVSPQFFQALGVYYKGFCKNLGISPFFEEPFQFLFDTISGGSADL